MDYKEKYNEALERARQFIEHPLQEDSANIVEYLFPELAENEDERMKKAIKHILYENYTDAAVIEGVEIAEIVTWLEEQGTPTELSEEKQNRFVKGVLTNCALSFIDYLDVHKYEGKMCVSNGECEDIENAFHNVMWNKLHRYYCKYIEKQGKKLDADKVIEWMKTHGNLWSRVTIKINKVIDKFKQDFGL